MCSGCSVVVLRAFMNDVLTNSNECTTVNSFSYLNFMSIILIFSLFENVKILNLYSFSSYSMRFLDNF